MYKRSSITFLKGFFNNSAMATGWYQGMFCQNSIFIVMSTASVWVSRGLEAIIVCPYGCCHQAFIDGARTSFPYLARKGTSCYTSVSLSVSVSHRYTGSPIMSAHPLNQGFVSTGELMEITIDIWKTVCVSVTLLSLSPKVGDLEFEVGLSNCTVSAIRCFRHWRSFRIF